MEAHDNEATAFTRANETRLIELQEKVVAGGTLSDAEVEEMSTLQRQYKAFLDEGVRRLREGALTSSYSNTAPTSSDAPNSSSSLEVSAAEALTKATKAAYFWGSLVATAVPGYLGRKTGIVTGFTHWNYIVDHLILGAIPVLTQVGSSGNHLKQLKEQLDERDEQLACVLACLEADELDGFGASVIQFAKEADWREHVNPDVCYILLPMEDTTAATPLDAVAKAVVKLHECLTESDRNTAYIHCKAGKGRSWMLTMCYLTTFGGMQYDDAAALVLRMRGQINPSTSQQCFAREFPLRFGQWKSLRE